MNQDAEPVSETLTGATGTVAAPPKSKPNTLSRHRAKTILARDKLSVKEDESVGGIVGCVAAGCGRGAPGSVAELRSIVPFLAVIKFNIMLDHYVTVLEVSDDGVTVGDPLLGLTKLSRAEFEDKWRFVGVVLKRK